MLIYERWRIILTMDGVGSTDGNRRCILFVLQILTLSFNRLYERAESDCSFKCGYRVCKLGLYKAFLRLFSGRGYAFLCFRRLRT